MSSPHAAPQKDAGFSQTEAVSRCRNVKEAKIKTKFALLKLSDEEVTVYNDNLDETFHTHRTQLTEQAGLLVRQENEAKETIQAASRKLRLGNLIDKLTALKLSLRFAEVQHQSLLSFKDITRQKREAFQVRLARLEQRQTTERTELLMAQQRVAMTVAHVRSIELNKIKNTSERRRKLKDNEISIQQVQMKSQKESEDLRELQLCKVKHLGELNDLDIFNAEELEDLQAVQKQEEFDMVAKHVEAEAEAVAVFEKQRMTFEATQLLERQKGQSFQTLRNQKRQLKLSEKAKRAAARNRERALLAENLLLSDCLKEEGEDDIASSEASGSERNSISTGMESRSNVDANEERDEDVEEKTAATEATMNAEKNAADSRNGVEDMVLTEEERELKTLLDIGRERQRALQAHHKKLLTELRVQHKTQFQGKQREHRKKIQEMTHDHAEELETLKADQEVAMEGEKNRFGFRMGVLTDRSICLELLKTQAIAREQQADTESSLSVLGTMLPGHIMAEIEQGKTPEPAEFNLVTVFFTDIYKFKEIVASTEPVLILNLLNALHTKFDEVISKYESLYKVECVSDTYMVASGLSHNDDKTPEEVKADTEAVFRCVKELQEVAGRIDLDGLGIEGELRIRVGVHSGPVFAGLVGNQMMSRYCLFGDTVNTASRMCTNSEPGRILVSPNTYELCQDIRGIAFEERGAVNVKGKGSMTTYWLQ
ncbi:Guanylate cyclase 2G [Chytridiales sp. JEL 0842]|nr:Guanylate cyclase 2G [Chytridiales sp. JEL 0842]